MCRGCMVKDRPQSHQVDPEGTLPSSYPGKEEREAQWATAQRTLHGLNPPETEQIFSEKNNYRELSEIADQARKRAEVAR